MLILIFHYYLAIVPSNPVTNIKFQLPLSRFTTLKIYDAIGRELETLVNQNLSLGVYLLIWDGMNYPAGLYFYKLISENYIDTKKMILIK